MVVVDTDAILAASAVERRAVADLLDSLDKQLRTPSRCAGWDVRSVAAHLASAITAPLTDALVHAGDMRIPLGLPHDPAADPVQISLDRSSADMPPPPTGTLVSRRISTSGWLDPDNAGRLVQALDDLGFGLLGLTEADFSEADTVVQLGHAPKRIDLLTSIDGVSFDDCWPDHVEVDIARIPVPFIDIDHLLVNERAPGRLQDLAGAEALSGGSGTES